MQHMASQVASTLTVWWHGRATLQAVAKGWEDTLDVSTLRNYQLWATGIRKRQSKTVSICWKIQETCPVVSLYPEDLKTINIWRRCQQRAWFYSGTEEKKTGWRWTVRSSRFHPLAQDTFPISMETLAYLKGDLPTPPFNSPALSIALHQVKKLPFESSENERQRCQQPHIRELWF